MSRKRDFLSLADFSKDELLALIARAGELKKMCLPDESFRPLAGRCVGIMFEKSSTRTRVSFEVGIRRLGGHAIFLSWSDVQTGRGEPLSDTGRVLSRYLDAIVIRTYGHHRVAELAHWSTIPVINGLSDLLHPCQVLSDLLTVTEVGLDVTTMHAAWIGDGNNMANSWLTAAGVLGFTLSLACPEGYEPSVRFDYPNVTLVRDPEEAIRGAQVVSTDVWASMGQEHEAEERREVFKAYQLNPELLAKAAKPVYILHCLPAHRGEEITDEVMESETSLIWEQAENRLHTQMAILEMLFRNSQ
ncbi:MAG: ornithine carbamoyltransferase [Thermodesulfobacteriota bacterium]